MKVSFVVGYTKQYPKMNVTELKKIMNLMKNNNNLIKHKRK